MAEYDRLMESPDYLKALSLFSWNVQLQFEVNHLCSKPLCMEGMQQDSHFFVEELMMVV